MFNNSNENKVNKKETGELKFPYCFLIGFTKLFL